MTVRAAVARQALRPTPGTDDIASYVARQVGDQSHREILGPLTPGHGPSGVVSVSGDIVATWGDPSIAEMCFSATKSFLSIVAGLAFDRGLLPDVTRPVGQHIDHPTFHEAAARGMTWEHLLGQTSAWQGELWGKPVSVDVQSSTDVRHPGQGWAYNDVRVNLLALALTVLWRRSLHDVFATEIARPLALQDSWTWYGYDRANVSVDGAAVQVVSGGAHWGGGLWASARDLAAVGQSVLDSSQGRPGLLSRRWVDLSWHSGEHNPSYGYLWWLNSDREVFARASPSGRCARGNRGRHLLWIDPDRELVVTSHWGEDVGLLLGELTDAVPVRPA